MQQVKRDVLAMCAGMTGIATSPNDKMPVPGGGMFLLAAYQHTGQASLSLGLPVGPVSD
jgi:hypothetical protein